LENCGVPVAADPTASLFYPAKLLFALPLSFAVKYKLYITGHVLLAAGAAFCLARHWHASGFGAALGAISYAFGGSVLFQYCNVVYLVGAAWLPLAFLAADRMLVRRSKGAACGLGGILSLMALGGDVEIAYNAGLLAALYAVLLRRSDTSPTRQRGSAENPALARRASVAAEGPAVSGWTGNRFVLLAHAAGIAVLLSAIQVLPSWEWSRHCHRSMYENPRSLYEIPSYLARPDASAAGVWQGICGVPTSGTHHEHIYHFSVGPWRLVELVWPRFSGQMFPTNRRWTNAIPAEGRIWTPSLYAGLLPLLLGLSVWSLRGGTAATRWMSWTTLLAGCGALGWYGGGWVIQEFRFGVLGRPAEEALIGQPVGGLYWLMVVVLPGYAYFRFPAKLLVISSLGLSMLAARGFDRLWTAPPSRFRHWLLGLCGVSLAAFVGCLGLAPFWSDWMKGVPADTLFGPLDAEGSLRDLRGSFLHAALVGAVAWWMLGRWSVARPSLTASLLLLLSAAEIAAANGWMVASAPAECWQRESPFADQIAARAKAPGHAGAVRVFRSTSQGWRPSDWSRTSDANRIQVGLRWDRETLSPKYQMLSDVALVESSGNCSSNDILTLFRVARQYGPRRPDGTAEPHPAVLNALGVRYLIAPPGFVPAAGQPLASEADPVKAKLWINPNAFPRAWIVHHVMHIPPASATNPHPIERLTREVFFPGGRPRDLRRSAVAESGERRAEGGEQRAEGGERELCEIVFAGSQRVEIRAELDRPGLVVLSDLFYPGWIARVISADGQATDVPLWRTNRIMRGVALPAGRHRIEFAFRPTLFYVGMTITLVSWLALGAGVMYQWRSLRRTPPPQFRSVGA
jgi:hypothetical protein